MYNQAANTGQQANAYQAAVNQVPAPPRTIASASSRLDAANERLVKVREHLTGIADQLGSLRAVGPEGGEAKGLGSMGAVGHLNDSADNSHRLISEIESLLASIAGALS